MRSCGKCKFEGRPRAAPSAACVLAFGRTRMDGDDGILPHMAALAGGKTVARASAYCKRCRASTWLCEEQAAGLDAAANALVTRTVHELEAEARRGARLAYPSAESLLAQL